MKFTSLTLSAALLLVIGIIGCNVEKTETETETTDDGPGHTADVNANTGDNPDDDRGRGHDSEGEENAVTSEESTEGTETSAAGPFETTDAMIAGAIELLENEDYEGLMVAIISPDDVAQLPSKEVFVESFGNSDKPAELLQALKSIQGTTPEMSDDGNSAIFPLPEPIGTKNDLTVVKVDGHWYLSN